MYKIIHRYILLQRRDEDTRALVIACRSHSKKSIKRILVKHGLEDTGRNDALVYSDIHNQEGTYIYVFTSDQLREHRGLRLIVLDFNAKIAPHDNWSIVKLKNGSKEIPI